MGKALDMKKSVAWTGQWNTKNTADATSQHSHQDCVQVYKAAGLLLSYIHSPINSGP